VKFTPHEKLSKKEQRRLNLLQRGSWHGLNPVTRIPKNPKAYNRQKERKRFYEDSDTSAFFYTCLTEPAKE
jgi:hypothetical protein